MTTYFNHYMQKLMSAYAFQRFRPLRLAVLVECECGVLNFRAPRP